MGHMANADETAMYFSRPAYYTAMYFSRSAYYTAINGGTKSAVMKIVDN
jgi:hypothetical protein